MQIPYLACYLVQHDVGFTIFLNAMCCIHVGQDVVECHVEKTFWHSMLAYMSIESTNQYPEGV